MFFTTNQWAILALVLVLGWLLGLLSRSGSAHWKRAYEEQRALASEHETRSRAANERIAELERHAPAIGVGTAAAIGAAARGGRDDLSLLRGVGRDGELRLNEAGYHRFRDIEKMSRSDEAALEGRLGYEPGRIEREQWREQAALLAHGKTEAYREQFGS